MASLALMTAVATYDRRVRQAAIAASLNAPDAELLAATLEPTKNGTPALADLSLVLDYDYHTEWPAARGEITIDWTRLESDSDLLHRGTALTYDEARAQFDKLVEVGIEAKPSDGDGTCIVRREESIPGFEGVVDLSGH